MWGHSYDHNIKPLQIIQRKAVCLITFSNFDAHTSPLFAKLNLLKLQDHINLFFQFYFALYEIFTLYIVRQEYINKVEEEGKKRKLMFWVEVYGG